MRGCPSRAWLHKSFRPSAKLSELKALDAQAYKPLMHSTGHHAGQAADNMILHHVAACTCCATHGLAERGVDNVDFAQHAKVLVGAASALAHEAGRMALILHMR